MSSTPAPLVAILAGGLGTRLRPLISQVPKSLACVAGEPFLFLLLRQLSALGIQQVLLLTGYKHEQVVSACGDGSAFNLAISYSQENEPLGTAGALHQAVNYLHSYSDFIVLNGDTFLEAPLNDFIFQSLPADCYGVLGTLQHEEFARYGSLQVNSMGGIEAFREKDAQSTGLISAGIYKLSTAILKVIASVANHTIPCSLERDIFPKLITDFGGAALRAHLLTGSLHDIGTPESYMAFNLERTRHEPASTRYSDYSNAISD